MCVHRELQKRSRDSVTQPDWVKSLLGYIPLVVLHTNYSHAAVAKEFGKIQQLLSTRRHKLRTKLTRIAAVLSDPNNSHHVQF